MHSHSHSPSCFFRPFFGSAVTLAINWQLGSIKWQLDHHHSPKERQFWLFSFRIFIDRKVAPHSGSFQQLACA
jgi:hypothetical protein